MMDMNRNEPHRPVFSKHDQPMQKRQRIRPPGNPDNDALSRFDHPVAKQCFLHLIDHDLCTSVSSSLF
jgi:hypothetical protein